MNRRRVVVVAVLVSALLVLGGYVIVRDFAALDEAPGVSEAKCNRIKERMTVDQVKQLMGCDAAWIDVTMSIQGYSWLNDEGMVHVTFSSGVVVSKGWTPFPETLFEKLGRWTGLW